MTVGGGGTPFLQHLLPFPELYAKYVETPISSLLANLAPCQGIPGATPSLVEIVCICWII